MGISSEHSGCVSQVIIEILSTECVSPRTGTDPTLVYLIHLIVCIYVNGMFDDENDDKPTNLGYRAYPIFRQNPIYNTHAFVLFYIHICIFNKVYIFPRKLLIMFLETHVFAPESQDFTHNSSDFELCCDLAGWHHPQNDERFRFCPGRQVSDSLLEFGVGK